VGWPKGRRHTDEERRRIGESLSGRPHPWHATRPRKDKGVAKTGLSKERRKLKDHICRYGRMTLAEYDALVEMQDGKCAICGRRADEVTAGRMGRLCVDHDHATDKVRGLLCMQCNVALGNFGDNVETLAKATQYLCSTRRVQSE